MMSTMRAAMYDSYGGPEVLYEGSVDKPVAGPEEVLVRVRASSVNGGELLARAGKVRPVTAALGRGFPKRVGIDFVGVLDGAGSRVTDLGAGHVVWGILPRGFGSAAEFVAVPRERLARAPEGVDPVAAAALPVGTTAITALRDKARLAPGERLLVRGASGGVGNIAVQLGRHWDAHVTALAGAANLDFVRQLGADEVFDYARTNARELGRFDVVLDTVGTELRAFRGLLTPSGRMMSIAFDSAHIVTSLAYIAGSVAFGTRRVRFFSGNPDRALFTELTRLTESGAVRPVVDQVYPLADIVKAHQALEDGGVRGKVVVDLD